MQKYFLRQLFDRTTCTYTYIFACKKTQKAILIDSVLEQVDRDLKLLNELNLKLIYTVDTHIHADHITGGLKIREKLNGVKQILSKKGIPKFSEGLILLEEGEKISVGDIELDIIETQGHTNGIIYCKIKDVFHCYTKTNLYSQETHF
jgi:sulfur dioxygenase